MVERGAVALKGLMTYTWLSLKHLGWDLSLLPGILGWASSLEDGVCDWRLGFKHVGLEFELRGWDSSLQSGGWDLSHEA